MAHLQTGDRVAFLDETGTGTVISVTGSHAVVRMDNGLEIPFPVSKLVRYGVPVHAPAPPSRPENKAPVKEHRHPVRKRRSRPAVSESIDWDQAKPKIPKVIDKDFSVDPRKIGEEPVRKKKAGDPSVWEVDLHIEELVEQYRHLSNGEILEIQLHHFHKFLRLAMEKRIPKVVVIHGVGTGRLREEIRAELLRYKNMEFYDASYREYGQGATEIRIWYGSLR